MRRDTREGGNLKPLELSLRRKRRNDTLGGPRRWGQAFRPVVQNTWHSPLLADHVGGMGYRKLCMAILSWLSVIGQLWSGSPGAARPGGSECARAGDPVVVDILCPIRDKYRAPAMAAAVVSSKGVSSIGAVGVRKAGFPEPVTTEDLWHLGSNTKAMTATLIARLVERGALHWETTVAEVFPELEKKFHPQFCKITVKHLLSHRAAVAVNLNWSRVAKSGTVKEQRLAAVKEGLTANPKHVPGTKYLYSNLGYVIAGAMVERITGKNWEECMGEEIFQPLGMKSAGFGGLGTPGLLNQPWGHRTANRPVAEYGPAADNPPVLGPAGTVHCTLQDWALFISDHLAGLRGERGLLEPASYQQLVNPPFGGDYALGWNVVEREWGRGAVLNHCGCNTMYFANVWIAPKRDLALLVTSNLGLPAFDATDEAVAALIKLQAADLE
jgi:CubicO group peptidase (beta-lactamase class C family)